MRKNFFRSQLHPAYLREPLFQQQPDQGWHWAWTAAMILTCLLYVGLALTPSSYASGLEMLGQHASGTFLGTARGIRSDEWIVYTPYVQIAVENGFAQTNALSPYEENLRSFQALPLWDWALAFKPYHWAFFVAPPAYGYSFYFFFMTASFLAGWALLMRRLGFSPWIAFPVALALYFSQYIQVWWTTNAGAFALGPWVALAWMYNGNRLLRIALTGYAIASWMLACAYPPFLYSVALAIGILILAFGRDSVTLKRLFDATVAGTIGLGVFIGYFHALIGVMQQTVYPGRRISASGGVEAERLLAHVNPMALINGYEPLAAFPNSNACEIAVLSTLLPLYALALSDHGKFRIWASSNLRSLWIVLGGLAIFCTWMFLSVHPMIARITGLYLVPPPRALLGFGLLLNISAAAYIALAGVLLTSRRIIAVLLLTGAAISSKLLLIEGDAASVFGLRDAVPLFSVIVFFAAAYWLKSKEVHSVIVVCTAALANILLFGLFNPVQSAHAIFNVDRGAVQTTLSERGARLDASGTLIAPGHYGALISGLGIRSVNHVLYTPQLKFFRHRFPTMASGQFDEIFNRYAHVATGDTAEPKLAAADVIVVPWSAFIEDAAYPHARPTSAPVSFHQLRHKPVATEATSIGHVDRLSLDGTGRIQLTGWSRAPLDEVTSLGIWANVPLSNLSVERVSRPDVAQAISRDLAEAGFNLTADVKTLSNEAEICIVSQRDEEIVAVVEFPDGQRICTTVEIDH